MSTASFHPIRKHARPVIEAIEQRGGEVAGAALLGAILGGGIAWLAGWHLLVFLLALSGSLIGAWSGAFLLRSLGRVKRRVVDLGPAFGPLETPDAPGEVLQEWVYVHPMNALHQAIMICSTGLWTLRETDFDRTRPHQEEVRAGRWPKQGLIIPWGAIRHLEVHPLLNETVVFYDRPDGEEGRAGLLHNDADDFDAIAGVLEAPLECSWQADIVEADLLTALVGPLVLLLFTIVFTGAVMTVFVVVPERRGIPPVVVGWIVTATNLAVVQWLVYRVINRPTYRVLRRMTAPRPTL